MIDKLVWLRNGIPQGGRCDGQCKIKMPSKKTVIKMFLGRGRNLDFEKFNSYSIKNNTI